MKSSTIPPASDNGASMIAAAFVIPALVEEVLGADGLEAKLYEVFGGDESKAHIAIMERFHEKTRGVPDADLADPDKLRPIVRDVFCSFLAN